jgi:hypothetical protein
MHFIYYSVALTLVTITAAMRLEAGFNPSMLALAQLSDEIIPDEQVYSVTAVDEDEY